jgi:hypothetical protein
MNAQALVERFGEQCRWAWTIRNQYRVLYEHGEPRLRLLDRVAQDYFSFMHTVLVQYIYLQFSRLTDPATQGQWTNLSAPYIAEKCEWPPEVRGSLRAHLKALLSFRERVVLPRQKLIAHADLDSLMSDARLGGFEEGEDDRFFESLQEFMNVAYAHVCGDIFLIESTSHHDATNLVWFLRRGVALEGLWDRDTPRADQLLRESEFRDA